VRAWFVAPVIALVGCDPTDGGELHVCDPFEAHEEPIELRTILGIGRDAAGTIYLADREDGEDDHVFVSEGGELLRRRIGGSSGGSDASGKRYAFGIEDPFVTLQIVVPNAAPVRIGVAAGDSDGFFEIGEVGEELEVVGEAAIADMPVRNLAGEVTLEYAAQLDDGRLIVVTTPRDAESYEEFRAFFGPLDAVDERVIQSFGRELDGGTTTIELDVDGVTAIAYFPVEQRGLPWTLTMGDDIATLAERDRVPDHVTFRCSLP
jgi:hypothetical protein